MKMQVGDVVHVRGKIIADGLDGPHVRFAGGDRAHVAYDDIVHHESRPLQVGDRVRRAENGSPSTPILAIVGEWVMVRWGTAPVCARVADLVRA